MNTGTVRRTVELADCVADVWNSWQRIMRAPPGELPSLLLLEVLQAAAYAAGPQQADGSDGLAMSDDGIRFRVASALRGAGLLALMVHGFRLYVLRPEDLVERWQWNRDLATATLWQRLFARRHDSRLVEGAALAVAITNGFRRYRLLQALSRDDRKQQTVVQQRLDLLVRIPIGVLTPLGALFPELPWTGLARAKRPQPNTRALAILYVPLALLTAITVTIFIVLAFLGPPDGSACRVPRPPKDPDA